MEEQFLDFGGIDRIEGRARFIQKEHFGIHRQGAGDTQPLLLSAGEGVGGFV